MQPLNAAEIELPPDLWQEKAGNFAAWAHDQLLTSEVAMHHMLSRGIKKKAIETWRLGFNDMDRSTLLKSWGLPLDMKRHNLWLPAGLVIPLCRRDKVFRLRIRRPQGNPKYFMVKGSCARLSMAVRCDHQVVVVVESELDAILLDQELGEATGILALGSSSAKPDSDIARQLKKAALILLALDYDDAGKKASAWWQANYSHSKPWPVPAGKDPGEAFAEHRIDIKEWFMLGLPPALCRTIASFLRGNARE